MYVGTIYQYDLWAEDIAASRITVATYDGFLSPNLPATFFMGQLARDGKIYVSSPNTVMSLTTIEYPNRLDTDCFVNQHAVRLPVRNAFGIPNFPNHRLGPLDGSSCDTLGIDNIPLANFRVDQDTSDYLSFYFQDVSAYEPAEWWWTFGDGSTSQDTSPIHTYTAEGVYEVCLTVSNVNGSHTDCQELTIGLVNATVMPISIQPQLFPNPFRDHFTIVFNAYFPKQAHVQVTDAAGQLVTKLSLQHGWNTIVSDQWQSGIYFYEIWDTGARIDSGKLIRMD